MYKNLNEPIRDLAILAMPPTILWLICQLLEWSASSAGYKNLTNISAGGTWIGVIIDLVILLELLDNNRGARMSTERLHFEEDHAMLQCMMDMRKAKRYPEKNGVTYVVKYNVVARRENAIYERINACAEYVAKNLRAVGSPDLQLLAHDILCVRKTARMNSTSDAFNEATTEGAWLISDETYSMYLTEYGNWEYMGLATESSRSTWHVINNSIRRAEDKKDDDLRINLGRDNVCPYTASPKHAYDRMRELGMWLLEQYNPSALNDFPDYY